MFLDRDFNGKDVTAVGFVQKAQNVNYLSAACDEGMTYTVPTAFAFPEFPLGYFLFPILKNVINIRMTKSDLAALTFYLTDLGKIDYYEDPRAPGMKFFPVVNNRNQADGTEQGPDFRIATPESFPRLYRSYVPDMITVVCKELTFIHCTFNMI